MELTFSRFMKIIFDKLWLLILLIVIFGLSAFSISNFLIKPKYQSQLSLIIQKDSTESGESIVIDSGTKDQYIVFTKSEAFLDQIKQGLKNEQALDVTIADLKNFLEISDDGTNSSKIIITITAYSSNDAFKICSEIADKSSGIYQLSGLFKGSEVQIIDFPKLNVGAISPNTPLNTVLGIILGVLFGIFLIISIETIDNSIKDENDLIDNYEVPLLGVVYTHRLVEKTENK